jgi:putative ABC transport system permease protein
MIPIRLIYRPLFRKGEHTIARIISLATGLAFGLLLMAEVFYYKSYDGFYPDANRIYVVHERFKRDNNTDKFESFPRVSGAIGPGMMAEVAGIELACRLNSIGKNVVYTEEMNRLDAQVSLADEYVFDLLPRPMIHGNPKEILQTPMACMVSSKFAENMGGNVLGKTITLKRFPGKALTIAGVFEDLPENTNYEYDLLISMVSTSEFTWDGTENWMGNDRYYTCVKLEKGITAESLAPAVRNMQIVHQDIEKLEEEHGGIVLQYTFKPIRKVHSDNMKDMILILITIATAVLFVSLMNYILLTLSALANRAKSSAVYKTFGAQDENLQQLIFGETLLLFLLSILGAILIIATIKPFAESQLEHSITAVLNPYVLWPLLFIFLVLLTATSYLPGRFFSRIPVATVFRKYRQGKNNWKLGLLAVQFIGASFILVVMIVVTLQYSNMKNADHGYRTKGIFYGSTIGMDGSKMPAIMDQLRAMPEVENVGLGYHLPFSGASGNNVYSLDGKRDLFNVADFYEADENFLSILDIQATEGNNFSHESAVSNDVLISQKGANMLVLNNGWTEGVVGNQITISEHGNTTIRGVFPDFTIQSLANPDLRPAVFFYLPEVRFEALKRENAGEPFIMLIQVHEESEHGMMKKITEVFNQGMAAKDAIVYSLEDELQDKYNSEKGFRNAMMAGNVVIFLITVIGLLGYTSNEANRRRKELAIRRVSGANVSNILRLFIRDLEYLAIPSVVAGLIAAWLTVDKWMQNFAVKIALPWQVFVLCSLFILLLVAVVAILNYTRTANRNPVEALRYE